MQLLLLGLEVLLLLRFGATLTRASSVNHLLLQFPIEPVLVEYLCHMAFIGQLRWALP